MKCWHLLVLDANWMPVQVPNVCTIWTTYCSIVTVSMGRIRIWICKSIVCICDPANSIFLWLPSLTFSQLYNLYFCLYLFQTIIQYFLSYFDATFLWNVPHHIMQLYSCCLSINSAKSKIKMYCVYANLWSWGKWRQNACVYMQLFNYAWLHFVGIHDPYSGVRDCLALGPGFKALQNVIVAIPARGHLCNHSCSQIITPIHSVYTGVEPEIIHHMLGSAVLVCSPFLTVS